MCINHPGSFECDCKKGYTLKKDRKSCQDVDECSINNGGCHHKCRNQIGGYYCYCNKGYYLDHDLHTCKGGFYWASLRIQRAIAIPLNMRKWLLSHTLISLTHCKITIAPMNPFFMNINLIEYSFLIYRQERMYSGRQRRMCTDMYQFPW